VRQAIAAGLKELTCESSIQAHHPRFRKAVRLPMLKIPQAIGDPETRVRLGIE
jgi:hypothetical protein